MTVLPKEYKNIYQIFQRYWVAYGKTNALVRSPYLHLAIICSMLSFSLWTKSGWWDLPISVLPNLIGFSLGGYAVWLSFGDTKFRAWLCRDRGTSVTIFMAVNSAFVHFICVQIISLLYAVISRSMPFFHIVYLYNNLSDPSNMLIWKNIIIYLLLRVSSFVGFTLFIYSIFCGLAATMNVFRFSGWLESHTRNPPKLIKMRKRIRPTIE